VPVIIAQALAEKGALDGVVTGLSGFFSQVFSSMTDLIEARPYVLIVVAVVLFLLLKKRR
jgi:phosphotransacetylase